MNTRQIKVWYRILCAELLLAGLLFLEISFFAEAFGIDRGGDWGTRRILAALMGSILVIVFVLSWFPRVKMVAQTDQIAKFSRYITGSALWLLITLGLCELLLRIMVIRSPSMIYEKEWGVVPVSGSVHFWAIEGYGTTHYLAHGEVATPFDGNGISVVVLGDSNTESLQVPDNLKFVSLAEVNVRSKGKDVDLHNLGRSGNSIPDYVYFAPLIKRYYNPEVVVVQLSPQDFYGEDGGDSFNPEHRNYFIVNDSGDLELRHNSQQYNSNLYNRLITKNMVYILGQERYSEISERVNIKLPIGNRSHSVRAVVATILPAAKINEQLKLLQDAYSGIKVIVLLLPYSPTIDNDHIIFDDDENFELLKSSVAKNDDFWIVDPRQGFQSLVEQSYLPRGFRNSLPGQGHMSKYGHIVVGELLAKKILEIIR